MRDGNGEAVTEGGSRERKRWRQKQTTEEVQVEVRTSASLAGLLAGGTSRLLFALLTVR